MNKEICLETMKVMYDFKQSNESYNAFLESKKGEAITDDSVRDVQRMIHSKLEQLKNLKSQMYKLQGFLHPERYKQVMSSLEGSIALTWGLENDCEKYISTKDEGYLDSLLDGLSQEKEFDEKLNTSFNILESQFGILVVSMALSNQMSIEQVRDLASSLEKGSNFQQNMEQLALTLERKKQNIPVIEEKKEETKEEQIQEEKEQVVAPSTPSAHASKPTFAERIAQVNYSLDGNMVAEVQEITIEQRMRQIAESMAEYGKKEKLSLKDMIELHTLQQEQIQLEAYADTLDMQKLSRSERKRNKLMKNATNKLEENERLLEKSKQNYQQYNSKAMRFFSARYQEQMNVNIEKLRQKRGTLQQKQRYSAIVKFNKNSRKLARSARVLGTIVGVSEFKDMKVEELRALRNQIVTEFQNMRQDIQRFKSERHLLPKLQESTVVMPDNVISLEEYKRTHGKDMVA